MRRLPPIPVLFAAALWACCAPAIAQQPSAQGSDAAQQAPNAPQPAAPEASPPPKKKAKPVAGSAPGGTGAAQKPAAKQPVAEKPAAAKPASGSTPDANPFPEAVSQRAAEADSGATAPSGSSATPPAKPPSGAGQNPFPEAVSRRAAQAAAQANPKSKPGAVLPPGVSSSSSSNLGAPALENLPSNTVEVTDPARAKKDTQVGDFYLSRGDTKGAYMRFKDAVAFDPTNMDAVFGLAQAAMDLKKFPEAERNYQLYLQVIPTGGKSKQALKQLGVLAGEK